MYVQHQARLDAVTDGVSRRATLEASAARGNAHAIEALTTPVYPDALEYLLDWSYELVGRSGDGMSGASALSWPTLDAWATRTGRTPSREDCLALMQLDTAFRHPDNVAASTSEPVPIVAPIVAWPTKKAD